MFGRMLQSGITRLEDRFKRGTKPTTGRQVMSTLADLSRSRRELVAENMFLRHQLMVLERQVGRPHLTQNDRRLLVMLASRVRGWKDALVVVKPDTLLRWHRQGFRLYWRRKTRRQTRKPRIASETIALIEEMAINNRLRRAKRIQGELLKLGIRVNKGTVKKYMHRARRGLPPLDRGQCPGQPSSPIMRVRRGLVISYRLMTCSFAPSLCISLSSLDHGGSCIMG